MLDLGLLKRNVIKLLVEDCKIDCPLGEEDLTVFVCNEKNPNRVFIQVFSNKTFIIDVCFCKDTMDIIDMHSMVRE